MQIPILIEPVPGNGYRARGGEPFALVGEGITPDDALSQVQQSLAKQLAAGARIVSLEVPATEHSWLPFAGMFRPDDPVVQEWLEIMQSRRDEPEAAA